MTRILKSNKKQSKTPYKGLFCAVSGVSSRYSGGLRCIHSTTETNSIKQFIMHNVNYFKTMLDYRFLTDIVN